MRDVILMQRPLCTCESSLITSVRSISTHLLRLLALCLGCRVQQWRFGLFVVVDVVGIILRFAFARLAFRPLNTKQDVQTTVRFSALAALRFVKEVEEIMRRANARNGVPLREIISPKGEGQRVRFECALFAPSEFSA